MDTQTPDTDKLLPPIMLLGNVRSGTTMMLRLFEQHPDIVGWFEPRTIWTFADPARPHDRFTANDATKRVQRYIRRRFLKYQRKHNNRRIMEKTPSNMLRIPYVRKIFPESRFVYLVREPLANLSSSELKWREPITLRHALRRLNLTPKTQLPYYAGRLLRDTLGSRVLGRKHVSTWGVRYPGIAADQQHLSTEQVIAKQWVACSQQAEEDLKDLPTDLVLRLRYEDFVADPIPQFQRVLEHFDLGFPEPLKAHVQATVDPGRQQKWHRLDRTVLRDCLPILQHEMSRHGYHIPENLRALAHGPHASTDQNLLASQAEFEPHMPDR